MKIITRSVKALADAIIEDLDEKIDLIYVDYRDQLTDEQIAAIVRNDLEKLWESLEEWESENRWQGAKYVIEQGRDAVIQRWEREDDEDYSQIASDFDGSDEEERVREEINERESGEWMKALVRQSGDVLLRIPIDALDEDRAYSYEPVEATDVLKRLGFEATDDNVKTMSYALANASPEFSTLMGYWIVGADVEDLYKLEVDENGFVAIENPHLYLGNPFMGDGFITEEALTGTAYVRRSDLQTDKSAFGYSVNSIYGGLNASQFEAKVRAFTDVLWVADFETKGSESGGHTLFTDESAARELAQRWAADDKLTVSIYPARLCQENDPAVRTYDFQRESYFAAIGDPIAIRK